MGKEPHSPATNQVASVINIPGYHIRDVLGQGGMATVYLAVQESIGREVALKTMTPDHSDPTFSDRFLREARIVSQLTHPNIITVYDAGVQQGIHYMSMEYIPGKNLRDAHQLLSLPLKIDIIKQIATALDFAGKKGYVHRDIKPENIMLHPDGRAILMDFGIARGMDVTQGLTQTGKAIGTPYYMSPEQTKGLKVDPRSDIYSLGVVMFHILSGYVPYDGSSLVAIGIKHISDPIPTLPKGLEQFQPIINKCMSKKPEHRYQSARELLDALNTLKVTAKDHATPAKAAASKATSAYAATVVENAVAKKKSLPPQPLVHPPRKQAYAEVDITTTEEYKALKRRRRLLLLILLIALGAAGYYRQTDILHLWQQRLAPWLATTLPENLHQYLGLNKTPAPQTPPIAATPDAQQQKQNTGSTTATAENQRDLSEIELLLQRLDAHPNNAVTIVSEYRDRQRQNNIEPAALKQQVAIIRHWFRERLDKAIERKDVVTARDMLEAMQNAFPRIKQRPGFQELVKQIDKLASFKRHMDKARVYIAANALTQPQDANALEELLAAAKFYPQDAQLQQSLQFIADSHYQKAQQKLAQHKHSEALTLITMGLLARPQHDGLIRLRQQTQLASQHQQHVRDLLLTATQRYRDKQYITPAGDSAYDIYTLILNRDPRNTQAVTGMRNIEQLLLRDAEKLLAKDDLLGAKKSLQNTQRYFKDSHKLAALMTEVNKKIDAQYPKIFNLQFSNHPFTSLQSDAHFEKVQPGQKIYMGFEYKNFYERQTSLTLKLLDQDNHQVYLTQPLQVSNQKGRHFFELTLPSPGNAEGNYQLQIEMYDSPVLKANLLRLH